MRANASPTRTNVITFRIVRCQRIGYNACMKDNADKTFQMRVTEAWLVQIDDWRRMQKDIPSRAEAIRRLVEIAISSEKSEKAST